MIFIRNTKNKRGQAAFEYLSTYGWAFMAAIITIGALSYFGFLSPNTLLPNKCDFGKQLECVESQVFSDGTINIMFKNNFGKSITITDVQRYEGEGIDDFDSDHPSNSPVEIGVGETEEITLQIDTTLLKSEGDKDDVNLVIVFERTGGSYPSHNITGTIFTAIQSPP